MNKRNLLQALASFAVVPSVGVLTSACSENKASFVSIDVTGADYAKDFLLIDHNGQTRSMKDFAGKVVVMFFGFTQCPDVCPTSMAELAEIKKLLGVIAVAYRPAYDQRRTCIINQHTIHLIYHGKMVFALYHFIG